MNTSFLLQFFSIILLSSSFASRQDSLSKNGDRFQELLRSGKATLESILCILEPETSRAEGIYKVLHHAINLSEENVDLNLVPGSSNYAIFLDCLDALNDKEYATMNGACGFDFSILLRTGNLPILKKFVEVGFKIRTRLINVNITKNNVEIVNFLVENGYDISREEDAVYSLLSFKEFTPENFMMYVKRGFCPAPDGSIFRKNWLQIAIESNRFDIVEAIFDQIGLRIRRHMLQCGGYIGTKLGERAMEFAEHMVLGAPSRTFEKIKFMFIQGGQWSMPKEMVMEIALLLIKPEAQAVFQDLFY